MLKISSYLYLCAAQNACIAQKINYVTEIANAYPTTADFIKTLYDAEMAMQDNYSYYIKNVFNSDFYQVKAEVSFTNLCNYPTFLLNFVLRKNIGFDGHIISGDVADINKIKMLDYARITAISTRY